MMDSAAAVEAAADADDAHIAAAAAYNTDHCDNNPRSADPAPSTAAPSTASPNDDDSNENSEHRHPWPWIPTTIPIPDY